MATYDPSTLQKLADRIDRQASLALYSGIATGILSGCLFGYAATLMFQLYSSMLVPGAIVGGVIGIAIGRQRSLTLKLQSQTALCQMRIEENTRKET